MAGFSSLAPKTKNLVVAGGLSAFVFGVYFYTMRAVGGTDELQTAIDKFEQQKSKEESEATIPSKPWPYDPWCNNVIRNKRMVNLWMCCLLVNLISQVHES